MSAIFRCWNCARRLNVDEVKGTAVVLCPKCRVKNVLHGCAKVPA